MNFEPLPIQDGAGRAVAMCQPQDRRSILFTLEDEFPATLLERLGTKGYGSLARRLYQYGFHKPGNAYYHDQFVPGQPSPILPVRQMSPSPSCHRPVRNNPDLGLELKYYRESARGKEFDCCLDGSVQLFTLSTRMDCRRAVKDSDERSTCFLFWLFFLSSLLSCRPMYAYSFVSQLTVVSRLREPLYFYDRTLLKKWVEELPHH